MTFRKNHSTIGGKVSIFTAILAVLILVIGVLGELPHGRVARASTATTSVTVLNTPPQWDTNVYVQEANAGTSSSATSTSPTNVGNTVTWYSTSTDSSGDAYYILLCDNYASPTPNSSAAPTCGAGGTHQIAVSAAIPSGTAASLSTTTVSWMPEVYTYYAYLCDGNATGPSCNPLAFSPSSNPNTTVATTSPNLSPFIVNHRPSFSLFINSSPINPGGTVNWFATATDADTYAYGAYSSDRVMLFVCKLADFTGTACGGGGTWATSSFVTNFATGTLTIGTPYPKGSFAAFGYVIDYHGRFQASGGQQGVSSPLVVSNVTPTIAAASLSLFSSTTSIPLFLTNLATQTQNFQAVFTVTDQNSCMTTASGPELTNSIINVFRSSVASTSCSTGAQYNPNRCYTAATGTSIWNYSCTPGACAGTSSATQIWTCSFPLWFLADATDAGSQFTADNWLVTASTSDSSFASSTLVESSVGTELLQFLGYDISSTTIAYGGLQPGNSADLLASTSVALLAQGNVGLDESLFGDDMCPTYPTCTGNATSTIFAANQKYYVAPISYAAATSTLSGTPTTYTVRVPKTIATSSIQSRTTYWGILVPGAITLSGNYIGRNTILGVTSPSSVW